MFVCDCFHQINSFLGLSSSIAFELEMDNIDEFIESFKQQLVTRGITIIRDTQVSAQNLADVFESRVINEDNCLPIFGDDGNEINPHGIDHEYETLDENLGMYFVL